MIWLLPLVVLSQAAPEPRPWLGVYIVAHAAEIKVGECVFRHGVKLESVVADSPAARAGLRAGDIAVAIDGADFDCPTDDLLSRFRAAVSEHRVGDTITIQVFRDGVERHATIDGQTFDDEQAWATPEAFASARAVGTRVELLFERVRELRTCEVTLGAAPDEAGAARPMPSNEAIFAEPPEHLAEERLADALAEQFEAADAYAALRAGLASLVETGDPLKLRRVAYAMREPFVMPTLARQMADTPATLPELLGHAAEWLDIKVESVPGPVLKTGLSPEQHARQIEALLAEVNRLCEQALAGLTGEEHEFIEQAVPLMGEAFIQDLMIMRIPDRARLEDVQKLVTLAAKVDRAKLIAAAARLAALVEEEYLQGLREDLGGKGDGIILKHGTPFGAILFAGAGESWFQEEAAVIVDLGGDDFYTQTTARPVNVIIDLGGNDQHQATFEFAQGFGLAGVALLYDHAGNDRYIARRWAQGSAAFGVGVLFDRNGDDTYRAADYSQGAAFCGVGLLVDEQGDDRYEAPRYAQALGMPGGFGALLERGGSDHYYCSGRDLTSYGTQGIFDAFGQGFGVGFRSLASGGVALLLDEAGDDVYEGGNFAQGGGYYFGWGCLVDRKGSDQYLGSRYAQAHAAHQAIGFLEDHEGNDRYLARRGVGQACAWDQTISVLLDHQGDDSYSGGGFCLAASAHNGLALLVDYAGRDRYQQHSGQARAYPNDYHGGACFSLLLDLGGESDHYPDRDHNNRVTHAGEHGFFADLPGGIEAAVAQFKQYLKP